MSKVNEDWYNLPPLQRRIIFSLAERGAQTRNQVRGDVKSETKNVLFSFNSLEEKGLIQVVSQKFYRGQKFPKFWLTGIGVAFAILNGSNPDAILGYINEGYSQAEEMRLIASLAKTLGSKALALALRMILSYPLEEAISRISVIALLEARKYTSKNSETLVRETKNVLKSYPQYYKKYLNVWRDISKLSEAVAKTTNNEENS